MFEDPALLGLKVGLEYVYVTVMRLPLVSMEREVEVMTGSVTVTGCRLSLVVMVMIEGAVLVLVKELMKIYDISRKEMITGELARTKIRWESSTGLQELGW